MGEWGRLEIPATAFLLDAAAFAAMAITLSYASAREWWPPVQVLFIP